MAKRFSSTEIWEEDWFLSMPTEYKLFWFYMLSNCDHAGLFKVNLRSFCGLNEVNVSSNIAIELFNNGKDRIRVVSSSIWLVEDFFVFQYGPTFNPTNRVHESIELLYKKHGIEMTSIRGLKDLKERVKDKDKDKDKDIIKLINGIKLKGEKFSEDFEVVWFSDGSSQKLGSEQRILAEGGDIRPCTIIKGSIY